MASPFGQMEPDDPPEPQYLKWAFTAPGELSIQARLTSMASVGINAGLAHLYSAPE